MRRCGFTMLELVIAIMVISVLAAIGVPNFLEAQTRAKVARARSDLAVIIAAAEHYRLDHHTYPPNPAWMDAILNKVDPEGRIDGSDVLDAVAEITEPVGLMGPEPMYSGFQPIYSPPVVQQPQDDDTPWVTQSSQAALTTPLAYLATVQRDPFSPWRRQDDNAQYTCVNWESAIRDGLPLPPFRHTRVPYIAISCGPDLATDFLVPSNLGYVPYNPTNGTVSRGDIIDFPR